ncbi:hypothetical protein DFH08DRAFT_968757 [Mycena albidolilacea]|uniref:Uncharacterized protein n=1 Tax=Mycena albidolilacea TaxID=1033008 RepID=A0AAD7EHD9_9AGAR|nr:hypothetical protein DFH08DRAFT_968757 [Mycena albidolilacea]
MRFTSPALAALCLFFSLSSAAVLGESELEARGGDGGNYGNGGNHGNKGGNYNSPCFPFIFEKSCVRGRCNGNSQKCELGFSIDPIRLCCVRQGYGNGGDGGGHGGGYNNGY